MKDLLNFFRELKLNNNREWFAANRVRWEEVRAEGLSFAAEMISAVAKLDARAAYFTPTDCTYRINRDTRFSPDKTPYKTHFGIFINPPYGKKALTAGYYFHLEPGHCGFYAGTYGLPSNVLAALRKSIYNEIDEYREIVESKQFVSVLPHLGDDFLKTAPKGYDKNWEHIDYLRPRLFCAYNENMEHIFLRPDAATLMAPYIECAKQYNDFLNYTIEDFDQLRPTPKKR